MTGSTSNRSSAAPNFPSARASRVARAAGAFAAIDVDYGPGDELIAALDETRLTALEIRETRVAGGKPLLPMPVIRTLADLGTGKTTAAAKFCRSVMPTDPGDFRRPAIIATLNTSGDQVSVPGAILEALGKPLSPHVRPVDAWRKAHAALLDYEVEIVIFDETNNAARRPSIGGVIGGDLMQMLVIGQVGVAFLGTEDTEALFARAKALDDRMKSPVVMKALDWDAFENVGQGDSEQKIYPEREIFVEFLAAFDDALAERGLIAAKAGLADDHTAKPLWEVCRGRLRPLWLLLEEAVTSLHRAGGDLVLNHQVLAQAVESHSIPKKIVGYNPFTEEEPQ